MQYLNLILRRSNSKLIGEFNNMDENYYELFASSSDMLNGKQLVEVIKNFQENQPVIYHGKGFFEKMIVNLNKGISQKEIDKLLKKYNTYTLPKDYLELLKFSNGINFFKYADDKISSLEDAFKYAQDDWLEQGYIYIARFAEDDFYMKCDGSERNIYFSNEGISDLEPLNMSFVAFVEASLISGFSYFWLWGKEPYDLY